MISILYHLCNLLVRFWATRGKGMLFIQTFKYPLTETTTTCCCLNLSSLESILLCLTSLKSPSRSLSGHNVNLVHLLHLQEWRRPGWQHESIAISDICKSFDWLSLHHLVKVKFSVLKNVEDYLHLWKQRIVLFINTAKHRVPMTFFRKNKIISNDYTVNRSASVICEGMKDLDVVFDLQLLFSQHIEVLMTSPLKMH